MKALELILANAHVRGRLLRVSPIAEGWGAWGVQPEPTRLLPFPSFTNLCFLQRLTC